MVGMGQRERDGTTKQPNYEVSVTLPLVRPMRYEVKAQKDGTVNIKIGRFMAMSLRLNVQDEKGADELIEALKEAKSIIRSKRKRGKIV